VNSLSQVFQVKMIAEAKEMAELMRLLRGFLNPYLSFLGRTIFRLEALRFKTEALLRPTGVVFVNSLSVNRQALEKIILGLRGSEDFFLSAGKKKEPYAVIGRRALALIEPVLNYWFKK